MKIGVVIPCRNEQAYIAECISAILRCELPLDTEIAIYVVDGMSDDRTRTVVNELCQQNANLHLIDNVRQLTPFAFNLGINAALPCDFIQIIGARHIVSRNYLSRSLEILQSDHSAWCVGGRIINEFSNETSKLISHAMSTSFGMGIGNFRTLESSGYTDTVTSPMYPVWVFDRIGMFDEELIRNQDDDFNFRVSQAGGKIFYIQDISLKYYVRASYKGLWRQFFQYGYWKVYVNRKHKAVTTLRQLVPPLFVLYLIFFGFAFFIHIYLGLVAVIPMALHIVLNIYFSARSANSLHGFLQLLKTYWILHLSYGLGYLRGIWEFVILGRKPSEKQKRLSR
jgi:glycosyltransferase involved in cell wall biosynthesis